MGKGDKKTRRGKITNGSYGKTRQKKSSLVAVPVKVLDEGKKLKEKKTPATMADETENATVTKPKATKAKAEKEEAAEEKPKTPRKKKTEE